MPAVHTVIGERVFGAQRREHLAAQHDTTPAQAAQQHAHAIAEAQAVLTDITTRQDNITAELEETSAADRAMAHPVAVQEGPRSSMSGSLVIEATVDLPKPAYGARRSGS